MAREFITAVEEKVEGGPQPVEVTLGREYVDDQGIVTTEKRTLTCHPPKEGQIALMMARMSRHASTNDKIAGIIDLFVEVLDEQDHQYVVDRLLDRKDPFGIAQVTEVMTYLVEEWGKDHTR